MSIFHHRDFDRVELILPRGPHDPRPLRWWEIQEWFAEQGVLCLSNKAAEFDEISPFPRHVDQYVWWDHFENSDRWSWYIPRRHQGLAALFKLTWGGQ